MQNDGRENFPIILLNKKKIKNNNEQKIDAMIRNV